MTRTCVPFFTMNNLNVTRWRPLANGHYQGTTTECGVYCRFDTDEVLEEWVNPITLEKRAIWEFIGGPFTLEIGPDGVVTRNADLQPGSLRMEVLGDLVFVPTRSEFSAPNPLTPQKWPTQSSGSTVYKESHATFSARVSDVADPNLDTAPAFCQFQNLATWHPWLGMGHRPGRTYGRAYGTKLKSVDSIPPVVRAGFERKTPEIFEADAWKGPRLDLPEYMKSHEPS